MLNIFYEPDYSKRKKQFLTLKFRNSVFFNKLIDFCYFFNLVFPNFLIINGPHKLMNNILKTFKNQNNISINNLKYPNSYIVQFDQFGEQKLLEIINKNYKNPKVLIGPLYTTEHLKKLKKYTDKFEFIKIVAASEYSKNSIVNELGIELDPNKVISLPVGVANKKKLKKNLKKENKKKCLIYFKNRNIEDLEIAYKFLAENKYKINIFKYGTYKNSKLIKTSKKCGFGVVINSTESQGIAIQELMAQNLPLLIWENTNSKFEKVEISGTSAPHWDNSCGIKVQTSDEFVENFEKFITNINKFKPVEYIEKNLTFEKFKFNLLREFDNF